MNFRQFVYTFNDAFFYRILGDSLADCKSVLDVGCGSNSPIRWAKKGFYCEGIDIYKSSITKARKNKIHDKYTVGDMRKIEKYYNPKSFDAVIAIDVIEHLKKNESRKLIKGMEKIARKKIIILTPNGFVGQGHFENNPYQEHKSGWYVKDLRKLGFKVYGLRGFKNIRGELASIKYRPWILWGFISFITEPLLYHFPLISFDLFAIKDIKRVKEI